jgi:hypothetical protein
MAPRVAARPPTSEAAWLQIDLTRPLTSGDSTFGPGQLASPPWPTEQTQRPRAVHPTRAPQSTRLDDGAADGPATSDWGR